MLALDHIVIAARNPEHAAKDYGNRHGVVTVQGGRHHEWGTSNHLAFFKNECYIEWIGVEDWQTAEKSKNPLIRQVVESLQEEREGIIRLALRTEEMDKYQQHFQESNIPYTGPFPGSRTRPDGSQLEWKMLFPEGEPVLPFLIEWGQGINSPEDPRQINTESISSITWRDKSLQQWSDIFSLAEENQGVRLSNTHLQGQENVHAPFLNLGL
ncbi:VOC family protein [Virgibacillus xinjiangensis]|uniref:VOC family protein n=1 Tax=Virgibacillus xinjiangensis TaxID=393090 RepID=A0ABV7CSS6_9BACI